MTLAHGQIRVTAENTKSPLIDSRQGRPFCLPVMDSGQLDGESRQISRAEESDHDGYADASSASRVPSKPLEPASRAVARTQ